MNSTADTSPRLESLGALLDALRPKPEAEVITVADLLSQIGGRSFAPVVLVPAVLLVSPLSGIPGTPTIGGLIVLLITVQALLGRNQLWLPGFLRNRSLPAGRLTTALDWLIKPAEWMDRYSRTRLDFLTRGLARWLAFAFTALTAISWPILELVPFFTSFSAGAVAMIMFGLMTQDGVYTLAGYVQSAALFIALALAGSGFF